jgi:predicted alpha-1,2-mannosidase
MPDDKPLTTKQVDITPSVINVKFKESEITLIPTETGAILKFNGDFERVILKRLDYEIIDDYTIIGTARETTVFSAPIHTILHVVIKSNRKLESGLRIKNNSEWRIGTSFISEVQAISNIPVYNTQTVLKENDRIWNSMLGRIRVTGGKASDTKKLYTMLYRALLFPRSLKEPNDKHYSPYSKHGGVFSGELSTDSGFWDAYRTVYPFLHLVYPDYASKILDGWINSIKESPDNVLAQWASPGKVNSMEGAMGEIAIAEGIMNNAITDVDTAWSYLYRSCFTKNGGRESFELYELLGYVPKQVSLSLNYYLSDYIVSLAARKLGHYGLAEKLVKRSRNWKQLFDRGESKMFKPKSKEGETKRINEYQWMGPYREGGPWQYRFYVPHDPVELNNWGYDGDMCSWLRKMVTNNYRPKNLRNVIHEEKEMYDHMFGQYAHNNQPVHHVLYMFYHVGCGDEGQKWIRHTLDNSYTASGYPGDEDNGEMSAWYILSSIGLYSLVPGSLSYQVGTRPLWDTIDIDHGRIQINNNGDGLYSSVYINDKSSMSLTDYNKQNYYRIDIS